MSCIASWGIPRWKHETYEVCWNAPLSLLLFVGRQRWRITGMRNFKWQDPRWPSHIHWAVVGVEMCLTYPDIDVQFANDSQDEPKKCHDHCNIGCTSRSNLYNINPLTWMALTMSPSSHYVFISMMIDCNQLKLLYWLVAHSIIYENHLASGWLSYSFL